MKKEFRVVVYHSEAIKDRDLRRYIKVAVSQWAKGGHPEDPLWSIKNVTVKNFRKPKEKAENKIKDSSIVQKIWELRNTVIKKAYGKGKIRSIEFTSPVIWKIAEDLDRSEDDSTKMLSNEFRGDEKSLFGIKIVGNDFE